MSEFINGTKLEFTDIGSESVRTYTFIGGSEITIYRPKMLNVSASGGHRIFDSDGYSHYIPTGWIHLKWKTRPGYPSFVA